MKSERCKFRVCAKKFLLTYSQVPEKLTPDSVSSQLQEKVDFAEYVIGTEYHEDGGRHFHVIIISQKKQDIRSATTFEIEFQGETYVGNCAGVKSLSGAVKYVCKSGTYNTNMKNIYNGGLRPLDQLLRDMVRSEGIKKTLQFYNDNYPKLAMGGKSLLNVERYLTRTLDLEREGLLAAEEAMSTPFKVSDFKSVAAIEEWISNGFQPTLVMLGPAGSGKTQYAKSLAHENNWKMLIANHREGLKALTREHNALLLDDMSLQDLDEHIILSLLERNDPRSIRILHGSVTKGKDLIQILAFNREVFLRLRDIFTRKEYSRRCRIVQIPSDFIVNVNIQNNFTIHIHNNIYNNEKAIEANHQAIIDIANSRD